MLPTGNGYFLWMLERCSGGNPAAMADKAVRSGLKWVAIKVANGTAKFGNDALNRATVAAFRARGISVWAWHYVYGHAPVQEAEMGARQTIDLGLDGYFIDAEVEFKLPGRDAAAKTYMDVLRSNLKKPIGLTAFRFPSLHMDFPWNAFLPRVEFNAPQVYWIGATNAGQQLQRSVTEFQRMRPGQPIIPLGAAFTEYGWNPTEPEILEFRNRANELGLPGYGWWEWYFAETRNPMWWDASTKPLAGEPPIPDQPKPVNDLVATRYSNLRIRSGPSTDAAIIGVMQPNKAYTVVEKSGSWGKLSTGNQWVYLDFTQKVKRVSTRFSNLRIRKGPGFNYAVMGFLPANATHLVVDESGVWGRLEGSEERWVHLHYITAV